MLLDPLIFKIGQVLTKKFGKLLCQKWWNHPNPQYSPDFQTNFWDYSKTTVAREKPKVWLAYSICVDVFWPQEVQSWTSFEGENCYAKIDEITQILNTAQIFKPIFEIIQKVL